MTSGKYFFKNKQAHNVLKGKCLLVSPKAFQLSQFMSSLGVNKLQNAVILVLFQRYPLPPLQKYQYWKVVSLFISDVLRWTRAMRTVAPSSRNVSCSTAHVQVIFAFQYYNIHIPTQMPTPGYDLIHFYILFWQLQWNTSLLNVEKCNFFFSPLCWLKVDVLN